MLKRSVTVDSVEEVKIYVNYVTASFNHTW